jgi:hypothetical protein
MGLIEAILAGIQFERLQKPLVFFTMLIGFIFFGVAGLAMLYGVFEVMLSGKEAELMAILGILSFSLVLFGLAAVCGYMIKRCFN